MPRPNRNFEKSKDFKQSMKKLFHSLKKYHFVLALSIVLAMTSAILSLIAPNKLSDLTNYITDGLKPNVNEEIITDIMNDPDIDYSDKQKLMDIIKDAKDSSESSELLSRMDELPSSIYDKIKPVMDLSSIRKLALILAIFYIVSSIFGYIQQLIMANVTNNYAKKLRASIIDKIAKLPLKYFDNNETGDVLSRITNDVDSIGQNMNQSLSGMVTNVTLFLGSIIMMFVTNPIMAITGIVASLIGFIFMFVILSKSQKYFIQRQEELGKLNGYIEEIYSSHNIVSCYNGEKETNMEFDRLNNNLFDCCFKSQFLSGVMHPFMGFVGNLGYVAVCVVGALLTMNNVISFGVIVAFMIYIRMFTNPLSQIAQGFTSFQSTAAAAERVFEFLEEEEMPSQEGMTNLDVSKALGNVEFKNVKFGYNPDRLIIKDFSASVSSGQKIAIVGPTGSGKTTIVNLLMKFYDINSGDILIDGVSIKNLTRENIHDLFCMVLQDTWLFEGSIEENIRFNSDVTRDDVWHACDVVGIKHFVKSLPGGIESQVGDNDAISQGQKQLITIARGMIEKCPFLILDEATSNVDTRTEELVQVAMDRLMKGKTSFIIAHRLSTIKNADLILVMRDGNIIEQGTHDELINKKGYYAELYNSQFQF